MAPKRRGVIRMLKNPSSAGQECPAHIFQGITGTCWWDGYSCWWGSRVGQAVPDATKYWRHLMNRVRREPDIRNFDRISKVAGGKRSASGTADIFLNPMKASEFNNVAWVQSSSDELSVCQTLITLNQGQFCPSGKICIWLSICSRFHGSIPGKHFRCRATRPS